MTFVYRHRLSETTMRCPSCDGCGSAMCEVTADEDGWSDCHKVELGAHGKEPPNELKCENCGGSGIRPYDPDYDNCPGCGNYKKFCEC